MGRLRYGPAGKPITYKGPMELVPGYLREIGLDAFEYEAVRGVRISEEKARELGSNAESNDVLVSMHAPYYVNLSSPDRSVWEKSVKRIVEALIAAEWMGAYVVVVHTGYYKGNKSRREALKRAVEGYLKVWEEAPSWVRRPELSPELMGKTSQLGDLEEVVAICQQVDRCRPTIDWAHLHARFEGRAVRSVDEILEAIEFIEKNLGREAVSPLHTHFSKIEYGRGGERMHHTLSEEKYGPEWSIVCKAYREAGIDGVIISESPILEKDAIFMKKECHER
ncbi:MAG: deoxyribonuclease IV [Desulfurococcales archaeon]|nr:deoxyribonuclease IV [Desulfurococcales archaeon]